MQDKISFIPKTKYSQTDKIIYRGAGLGQILKISIFLFVLSSLFFLGTLVYKEVINRQLDDLSVSLERAKASFDSEAIKEMENLSSGISMVKNFIAYHPFPSRIFSFLEENTLSGVRFSRFDYSHDPVKEKVGLRGEAKNYAALAQQVKVFEKTKEIENFTFSNFVLTQGGNVSFDLEIIFNFSTLNL
ncbi:hypothetical protein KKB69_00415 [Patescibacteria group bacterium]|nr:hypothetical protein [Patescibacteria group bacterium]